MNPGNIISGWCTILVEYLCLIIILFLLRWYLNYLNVLVLSDLALVLLEKLALFVFTIFEVSQALLFIISYLEIFQPAVKPQLIFIIPPFLFKQLWSNHFCFSNVEIIFYSLSCSLSSSSDRIVASFC